MDYVHLAQPNGRGGHLPICGAAMWEALTRVDGLNECWECASIAGVDNDDTYQDIIDEWLVGNISQATAEAQALDRNER